MTSFVARVFGELQRRGLRYAVLRNYEHLPSLEREDDAGETTGIDLVIHSDDLPRWRRVVVTAAQEEGVDAIAECDNWTQPAPREHQIEVFRFYRLNPLGSLRIDVSHGLLIWGLTWLDEAGMLQGRRVHTNGLVLHIDPVKEAVFKMVQIYDHRRTDPQEPRIARYQRKLVEAWTHDTGALRAYVRRTFWFFGSRAMRALAQDDVGEFDRNMGRGKVWFVTCFVVRHPLRAWRCALARWREHRMRLHRRQCGQVLRVHAPEEAHRRLVRESIVTLRQIGALDGWQEKSSDDQAITPADQAVMEQGGWVIQWSDAATAHLDSTKCLTAERLKTELLLANLTGHEILYQSERFASRG